MFKLFWVLHTVAFGDGDMDGLSWRPRSFLPRWLQSLAADVTYQHTLQLPKLSAASFACQICSS